MRVASRTILFAIALLCGLHGVAANPDVSSGNGVAGVQDKDGVVSDRDWRKREPLVKKHFGRAPNVEAVVV
ncbi:hypothetical protein SCHPADRAFT_900215 [Schizopora paradoxa]|uniref:Uncharacterized protein n=1 Tax=Schizopora paradoxa TaxID=27342 RepID=A0A0H2SL58_9AGAM|nr:hypothetical protein SCHPADRAFT_900215 [Schizopora paradoxa]